ncbi:MAG: LCP family protein [Defluviitaleaceae bacterium]|nr:LCP family protein [Defluviitaleaceae bacterium]
MEENTKENSLKGSKALKKFLLIILFCVSAGVIGLGAGLWIYIHNADGGGITIPAFGTEPSVPARTNFAILGVDDDGTRTDTIMTGSFNSETGAIDLISIPRDTYVEMPEERMAILRAEGRWVPAGGVMKMNQVHHYAGPEHGLAFAVAQLEDLLGITIDYSARVNLVAFRHIVDALGGVEFDVPQRMFYRDPCQALVIDLQPGLQVLNGEQAEGLVRYRMADKYNPISPGYVEADLQRVRVQQAFLSALISQAMERRNLLTATGAFVTAIFRYVDTDFGVADVPKYITSLRNFSQDNISAMTLPVDNTRIRGQSFVQKREPDASEMLESIFGEVKYESSFGKQIMVLNGGETRGKANEVRIRLEEAEYTVARIADYMGARQRETRILVRRRGQGEDLLEFFNSAVILIDPQTDCDIKIIIGTDE